MIYILLPITELRVKFIYLFFIYFILIFLWYNVVRYDGKQKRSAVVYTR